MLCRFKRLIYPKTPPAEDSGYRIVLYQPCETVRDAAGHLVTEVKAVGFFLPTGENRSYELKGRWGRDSKYGVQFEVEDYREVVAPTKEGIVGYLSSGQIKGIGPKTAARIVEHFGEQTLLVMEREPERLAEVPGISREKAKAMGEEFRLQVGMRQLMEFFAVHHLPAELAVRAYKLYGDSTVELLYDDPYLLMDEGLDAPFGDGEAFGQPVRRLIGEIHLHLAAQARKNQIGKVSLQLRFDDQHHAPEARAHGVEDGIVHQDMAGVIHRRDLLQSPKTAA